MKMSGRSIFLSRMPVATELSCQSKHLFCVLVMLAGILALPANAITNGDLDGDGHPYVGLMVAKDYSGNPMWRCTGTMISPTVFLTAGHCTQEPAAKAEIWFESEVVRGDPGFGYPVEGPTSVTGMTMTHPDYLPGAFYLYDLGVVILDEPLEIDTYAVVPIEGFLDGLAARRGKQDTTITAVGYGLQRIRVNPAGPSFTMSDLTREKAVLNLVSVRGTMGVPRGTSVILSANANTGGTCFGDSGGPLFYDASNVIVAVTSFGINGNCAGVGGGYRIDMPDDLDWIHYVLENY
jgi:secreted trypsin-like serine protease